MRYLCAAAALSAVLVFAQNTPRPGDRDDLQRLEREWSAAHIRGDAEALNRLWADDLEVAVPKMPAMKKELIKFVASGRMRFQRYETSDLNVRLYGPSAVVTGRLERKREINGRAVETIGSSQRFINTLPTAGGLSPSTPPKPRSLKATVSFRTSKEDRHPLISSALKWAFADFENLNIGADRRMLSREDLDKLVDLLRIRPLQVCMFLAAFSVRKHGDAYYVIRPAGKDSAY